jgi:hypothetical protein
VLKEERLEKRDMRPTYAKAKFDERGKTASLKEERLEK